MIELPGIANEYAQYIFVCISIEVIYSHVNLFMYKYYAYSWASKLSAPNGENRVNLKDLLNNLYWEFQGQSIFLNKNFIFVTIKW